MHRLLIPFASGRSPRLAEALPALALPNLERLLRRLTLVDRDDGDARSLSTPAERAFAAAAGWHGGDGRLPFAAHDAAAEGLDADGAAWGRVTPCHWAVGRDRVTMTDPAALDLAEGESTAAFETARTLFDADRSTLLRGGAGGWFLRDTTPAETDDALDRLACASLDRVIGRDVEAWLGAGPASTPLGRRLRSLQGEFQMSLHPHPLNEDRERRGLPALNSFWLSDCGRRQPVTGPLPTVDGRLRAPALADDAAGWVAAWSALDAGPIAVAARAAVAGETVVLTLCGERGAHRFEATPRSAWQRLATGLGLHPWPGAAAVLEAL